MSEGGWVSEGEAGSAKVPGAPSCPTPPPTRVSLSNALSGKRPVVNGCAALEGVECHAPSSSPLRRCGMIKGDATGPRTQAAAKGPRGPHTSPQRSVWVGLGSFYQLGTTGGGEGGGGGGGGGPPPPAPPLKRLGQIFLRPIHKFLWCLRPQSVSTKTFLRRL